MWTEKETETVNMKQHEAIEAAGLQYEARAMGDVRRGMHTGSLSWEGSSLKVQLLCTLIAGTKNGLRKLTPSLRCTRPLHDRLAAKLQMNHGDHITKKGGIII